LDPKGKVRKRGGLLPAVLAWKNALNIDDSGAMPDKDKKDMKPRQIPPGQQIDESRLSTPTSSTSPMRRNW